jgi:hypothetical protein
MLKYSYDLSGNVATQAVAAALAPQIKGQPVGQIVEPGQIASLSVVVADASGVTFQWKFNGADIPGATGDSLLLTNVSTTDEGLYSVVVTNSAGSVTSAPAELLLDSERDGLPDSWEMANFGTLTGQRGEGDPDQDGVSNVDEFFAGTDPSSPTSLRPRLTVLGDAGGSVAVSPMKLEYNLGETVTLTATPFAPSTFVGWTGDLKSTTNPTPLTMNANKTVRARFTSPVPLPPGLVAFWRGETDAKDLIGGHDGAFFVGTSTVPPSITPSGKIGAAFNFDGTVHMRVPDAATLKPAQITIEVWVFPTTGTLQTVVARGSSVDDQDAWLLGVGATDVLSGGFLGYPRFQKFPEADLVAPSVIPLNEWTHLAISFDGTTKRLYVNGRQVASQGGLGALVYDPAAVPVTIGSDWASNASSARFNGRLDEVAIYNRALTNDEIWDIYNADVAGKNVANPYFTSPSRLPDAVLGASYSEPLTTILGTAPISFSLSAGALPPGVALSSAGVLSGVPSAAGTFDFTVRATDAANKTTEQLCLLRVL